MEDKESNNYFKCPKCGSRWLSIEHPGSGREIFTQTEKGLIERRIRFEAAFYAYMVECKACEHLWSEDELPFELKRSYEKNTGKGIAKVALC